MYYSPAVPPPAPVIGDSLPVLVSAAGPYRQRRVTVAFRWLLAIPHFFVLYFLTIAAEVVAVIGWFGALFTGHLPRFAADFLGGFVRWYSRVAGYSLLLTDAYPPFALADSDYPIRVLFAPGRLNRLAVLFRLVLLIPAWIVGVLAGYGIGTIVLLVAWIVTLIRGSMPATLHQAFTAVFRYLIRLQGYVFMLTATYPGGLFGDTTEQPEGWQLTLSTGAKRLVAAFLVLGALTLAGAITANAVNHDGSRTDYGTVGSAPLPAAMLTGNEPSSRERSSPQFAVHRVLMLPAPS